VGALTLKQAQWRTKRGRRGGAKYIGDRRERVVEESTKARPSRPGCRARVLLAVHTGLQENTRGKRIRICVRSMESGAVQAQDQLNNSRACRKRGAGRDDARAAHVRPVSPRRATGGIHSRRTSCRCNWAPELLFFSFAPVSGIFMSLAACDQLESSVTSRGSLGMSSKSASDDGLVTSSSIAVFTCWNVL
jgi:hypothetical protein